MNFELLPNEILIISFQYLNAPDLFNAFDELNYRFQTLITNIALSLNCQYVKKTTFDQFCQRMLANPEMKTQIISLQLSNLADTFGQISSFLSLFSLNEFPNLRSLTLMLIHDNESEKITSMLPSLSNISYFYCDSCEKIDTILSVLPLSNLRKLNIAKHDACSLPTQNPTLITHLSVYRCDLDDFNKIFTSAPMLKYFKVAYARRKLTVSKNEIDLTNHVAIYLTQLNLRAFVYGYNAIETIFKQTPNLKILTLLIRSVKQDIIDANRWRNLISTVLPQLYIFKFLFNCSRRSRNQIKPTAHDVSELYKQFQADFWIQQHHWYTAYELKQDRMSIFTIPYLKNYYELTCDIELYCNNPLIDRSKLFDNVTQLTLSVNVKLENFKLKFSNIKLLILQNEYYSIRNRVNSSSEIILIEFLKNNVNLLKLKHLELHENCELGSALTFLEMFERAPQLSSLTIFTNNLLPLLNNDELCNYFNKMITKLNCRADHHDRFISFDELKQVWKIFSNVKVLQCDIDRLENLVELLNQLPKLWHLFVLSRTHVNENTELWLEENLPDLHAKFDLNITNNTLSIRIESRNN